MNIEVLIAILIILFSVYKSYKEEKKKAAARAKQQAEAIEDEGIEENFSEEIETLEEETHQSLRQKISKTSVNSLHSESNTVARHFSYEDNSGTKNRIPTTENKIELSENEEFANIELTFDEEEIKRGIIYSEILKRPDF